MDSAACQQAVGLGETAKEAGSSVETAHPESDDDNIQVSQRTITPDTDAQTTSSDPTRSVSKQSDSSTRFQRNTRNSLRQAGISIDALFEPKLLLDQLRDKKSSIYQVAEGVYVDISCNVCGANRAKRANPSYGDPRFTLSGLRIHYSSCHDVPLDEARVYTICGKTKLEKQDIDDILNDREPANEKLRDRVQPKELPSTANKPSNGTGGYSNSHIIYRVLRLTCSDSDSDPSVLSVFNESPDPLALITGNSPTDVSGILSNEPALPSPAQVHPLKRDSLKRKYRSENATKDKENAQLATQRRARLSGHDGAMNTDSSTMQGLCCEGNGDGGARDRGSSAGRRKKTVYEVFGELGARSLAC